jgi:hypothetical protein
VAINMHINRRLGRVIKTRYPQLIREVGIKGPICQVGSLISDPAATPDMVENFRGNFSTAEPFDFTGIDLNPGPNVDVIADLCEDSFEKDNRGLKGKFGFIICRSVLEQTKDPFAAARHINYMLKPGGHLYLSNPWVWGYHSHPDDYWRISFSALGLLFPDLEWVRRWYEGTQAGIGIEPRNLEAERKLFQFNGVTSEAGQLLSDKAMPYLNIVAIGRKAG